MGANKYVEQGFGYVESEHEVSSRLVPRDGELFSSVPEIPEPFNYSFRAVNPERTTDSNSPQNLGSVDQNLVTESMFFFVMRNGNFYFRFFCLLT